MAVTFVFYHIWGLALSNRSLRSAKKTSRYFLADLSEEDFREELRDFRRRLSRSSRTIESSRWIDGLIRELITKRRRTISDLDSPSNGIRSRDIKPKTSRILAAFYPERSEPKGWKKGNRKSKRITIENFCLIDRPTETLNLLSSIAQAEARNRDIQLDFLMDRCTDIAAFLVLGLMRRDMNKIFKGGLITEEVRKVVDAVELAKFLNMRLAPSGSNKDIWPFALRTKTGKQDILEPQLSPQRKDKVATDLVESIQTWLREATQEGSTDNFERLSEDDIGDIEGMVTELLDNAERHGSPDAASVGGWSIAGFMSREPSLNGLAEADYVCHLAIVSEGLTIDETLRFSEHEPTKVALTKYLFVQKQIARFSGPLNLLRTVMSLQPGITRVETEGAFGGTGFPKVIDWLNKIGGGSKGRPPQLTIISGQCCLTLKDAYNHRRRAVGGLSDGKFNFFNGPNSFNEAPDPRYVFTLEQAFPGTIIAMRFPLCRRAAERG